MDINIISYEGKWDESTEYLFFLKKKKKKVLHLKISEGIKTK